MNASARGEKVTLTYFPSRSCLAKNGIGESARRTFTLRARYVNHVEVVEGLWLFGK